MRKVEDTLLDKQKLSIYLDCQAIINQCQGIAFANNQLNTDLLKVLSMHT